MEIISALLSLVLLVTVAMTWRAVFKLKQATVAHTEARQHYVTALREHEEMMDDFVKRVEESYGKSPDAQKQHTVHPDDRGSGWL